VTITFKSSDTYKKTKEAWKWLSEDNNRNFVMIVEHPTCENGKRLAYIVEEADYDSDTDSVTMTAKKTDWAEAMPTFHMLMDTEGVDHPNAERLKRFVSDNSIDITHDFSGPIINEPFGPINFELDCVGCVRICLYWGCCVRY
jgi:hypothetical protein